MSTPTKLPNWTGLLGWSTTYHDGTGASQFGSMDEDRKKWLETALNSAFGGQEDPMQIMKKAVEEVSEGHVSVGLDLFDYTSDFLDCAENFAKVGGLACVFKLLQDENSDLVKRAMEILAAYLPNNARLQLEAALKQDGMVRLKKVIKLHSENNETVAGAVSVIGCLIRNVTVLEASFIREDGIEFLSDLVIPFSNERVTLKVISIFSFLASRHDLSSKTSTFNHIIQCIYASKLIDPTDIQFWETVSNFVNVVVVAPETLSCISNRISWISSLDKDKYSDYSDELKTLKNIV